MTLQWADSSGIRIAYEDEAGAGPALVFIHGYRMAGAVWNDVVEALPRGKYRTIRIDLRGGGRSDKPDGGYALEDFAADVHAVLRAARVDRPVLIGHSMGGTIVQYLISRGRTDARAAVLVAPVPASGIELDDASLAFFRQSITDAEAARQLYAGSVADPGVVDRLMAISADTCRAAAEQSLDTWRCADFADDLATVNVPVLIIGGARDGFFTEELLRREILRRLSHGRFELVQGAGHFIPVEQPVVLARLVDEFVSSLD